MNLSEPQLISPLLDGFVMGDPISGHDGVRACPAMQLETDKKYIVKIISLPATQSKLDALLLAGAFSDRESAVDYFKELADGVVEEAALLQKLSRHEGFVSFENWQMVPMEDDETGFDIYLLSQYRPTLESAFRANEMTHLQAINLGLDLCAALSVSRRFGYLYSNLRPSNIYVCNEREFRIGDLGFLSLDSLPYASLPDKYHSDYTPPEISDAYSALNTTMDTYAVGLILYQAYNDGKLPPVGMPLEAPCHADTALTQIILKACAVDPEERWQDPVQMGQALANYMQSNTVNDTPIVPPAEDVVEEPEEVFPDEDTEPTTEDILAEVDEALDNAPPIIPAPESEEEPEIVEEVSVEEEETAEEEIPAEEPTPVAEEDISQDEPVNEEVCEEAAEEPSEEEASAEDEEKLEETAQILAQADDLIAHQLPDPPVAPEPIEVTLPDPEEITLEVPEEEESQEELPVVESVEEITPAEDVTGEENPEVSEEIPQPKKQHRGLKIFAIVLAAILLVVSAAFLFVRYFYLQTIHDISLNGTEDRLTVTLTTDVKDDLLSVRCTDTHGNALIAKVENGVANFVGLKSGTKYTLEVRIEGFHKLLGETTETYTTSTQTVINGFYAATGPEDGSVILSFTPQGPSSTQWTVTYSAEDEEAKEVTFNGHMVTLTGLTVGKEYTFALKPVTPLYVSGTDTITYTVSKIIYAENVDIQGYQDDKLVITWTCPEGITVPQWYIRCYNDAGFDKTLTTTETAISFEGLEIGTGYTIEVTAEGMTLGVRTYLSENSVTIKDIQVSDADRNNLQVTWKFDGSAPAGGWLLLYTVDGSEDQQVVACTENSGTITPLIPGAHYTITIQPADGSSAFGESLEYDAPQAAAFSGFLINADNIEVSMCKTPGKTNWDRHDVTDYTTSFKLGESASFVMHADRKTSQTDDIIVTLYVIRDAEGKLISAKYESRTWDDMWDNRYGIYTIPVMPENPGSYTVDIYFNGTSVTTQSFEVTAAE